MTAPPQYSPDGRWWWDGQRWVPVQGQPPAASEEAATPAPAPTGDPWAPQPPGAQPSGAQPGPGPAPWATDPAATPGPAPWAVPPVQHPPYGDPLPVKDKTDAKAVISLVTGIFWVFGIGSVVAVVLGHLSRSEARREGRPTSGLATAGLVLGYLGLAGTALIVVIAVLFGDEVVDSVKGGVELQTASDAERSYFEDHHRYTASLGELRAYGYDDLDGVVDVTVIRASATDYCLSAHSFGTTLYASDDSPGPSTDACH